MKRIGYLYNQINLDIVKEAMRCSSRGKLDRPDVAKVHQDFDNYADDLYQKFLSESIEFTPYETFTKYNAHSGKTRLIQKPAYWPDQVVQWCIVLVLRPIFSKGMYSYCCGSVPKRGTVYAIKKVKEWIVSDTPNTQFIAQLDIRKFYDSIQPALLIKWFHTKIKDTKMLTLIEKLINTLPLGVPIGNYTSQWFANFFLEDLDHLIKEQLHIKYYIRYMDDMVLFAESSEKLHQAIYRISLFLEHQKGLQLKSNYQVYPLEPRGLDFLGAVFHRDYTLLRARNFLAFRKQANYVVARISNKDPVSMHLAMSTLCRAAIVRRCNCFNIFNKYLPIYYENQLKNIVSKGAIKKGRQN